MVLTFVSISFFCHKKLKMIKEGKIVSKKNQWLSSPKNYLLKEN